METQLESFIRSIPDWPKPGIDFKDITPLLRDGKAFKDAIAALARHWRGRVDVVASAEARGFILGAALAYELGVGFVPLRKPGKLPWRTLREEYQLEYGKDAFEAHIDGVREGERVLVVDDVLATGGTANAACKIVERLGGTVAGIALLIELKQLNGREKLRGYEVHSLLQL